jgi:hypothetical protein
MASDHLGLAKHLQICGATKIKAAKPCLSLFRFSSPSYSSSVPREGRSPLVSVTWKVSPARTLQQRGTPSQSGAPRCGTL